MAFSAQPLIRESSLRQQALDELRRSVLSGRFQPGERLNEVEIAASLGVSRGPVREALQYLGSEGLISLVAHRGAFVPTFTAKRLGQLYEVRIALEGMAARIAAERGSTADIDDLRLTLEETVRALNALDDVPYPSDLDFHRRIISISGNPELLGHTEKVHLQLTLARSRSGYQPQRARRAYQEHVLVFEALVDRDADAAEGAMREHLESSLHSATCLFRASEDARLDPDAAPTAAGTLP